MRNNKIKLFLVMIGILTAAALFIIKAKGGTASNEVIKEIAPAVGTINKLISCTGTVLPKNRLEIKPPLNGRIDSILINEGDKVKTGQILAWMSSTERAALLDAARGQGEEEFKYWEETYKPISLSAPIDGEVIVATTQPGQTVTTSDAVLVLSDHLIIRAQVDETDIGKITPDMEADITLDAYPDTKIDAQVEHIYYESTTVNNVTIYHVDLKPREAPVFLRSGMNASVDFIEESKAGALLIPEEAVYKEKGEDFVFIKRNRGKEPAKVSVKLGISDDKNVEVISGISENDRIIVKTKKYVMPKNTTGSNPFMPRRR